MLIYSFVSIAGGVILSNSSEAAELPILSVTAILFGFTINAVVMLGNSSEHYLSEETTHTEELRKYYKKSLYISIHTLGIGITTIVIVGVYKLFPDLDIILTQIPLMGNPIEIELVGMTAYTLVVYYLLVFSIVIASAAELVKIRI